MHLIGFQCVRPSRNENNYYMDRGQSCQITWNFFKDILFFKEIRWATFTLSASFHVGQVSLRQPCTKLKT